MPLSSLTLQRWPMRRIRAGPADDAHAAAPRRRGRGRKSNPDDHDPANGHDGHGHGAGMGALALGALGIVYGDIGTSPLYAFRESFEHHHLDADEPGQRARRRVRGVLGADPHHLDQVPDARDARRQPRRGWHPRPDGDDHAEGQDDPAGRGHRHARCLRHGAALRRRPDHAGDLGAQRRRGLNAGGNDRLRPIS